MRGLFARHVPLHRVSGPGRVKGRDEAESKWESVTVEVLNPKTAIFYIAFLPQFTDPTATLTLWGQLMILGTFV